VNIRIILVVVILSAPIIIPACFTPTGQIVTDPLTEEEMAIPSGRYQSGVNMNHSGQVGMLSHQNKPVLEWRVEIPEDVEYSPVFVDSEGGVWYRKGRNITHRDQIVRLNPDSSEDWIHTVSAPWGTILSRSLPVVVLKEAVVCMQYSAISGYGDYGSIFLECLDLDGNVRWRSETVDADVNYRGAWRIQENRIAAATADNTLTIFSLENGELLGTVSISGWGSLDPIGPFPTHDGGFITVGRDETESNGDGSYVTRFSPDGATTWQLDFPGLNYCWPPCLSDDGLMLWGAGYNSRNSELIAIDTASGDIERRTDYRSIFVLGVTYEGNFLLRGSEEEDVYILRLVDPSGEDIWTIDVTEIGVSQLDKPIIFEDNSILIGHRTGFWLLNADGTIRWEVNSTDLGHTGPGRFKHWAFNPGPDGTLFVHVVDLTEGWRSGEKKELILGFGPG
jgi:hypothetical protein